MAITASVSQDCKTAFNEARHQPVKLVVRDIGEVHRVYCTVCGTSARSEKILYRRSSCRPCS